MQSIKDRRNMARFGGFAFVAVIFLFVVGCLVAGILFFVGRDARAARSAYGRAMQFVNAKARDDDAALACLDEAIRLDPRQSEYFLTRGNLYVGRNRLESAIEDYFQARRILPKSPECGKMLAGWLHMKRRDYPAAVASFSAVIVSDRAFPAAYSNRGTVRLLQKDFEGAIADFNEAIRQDTKSATAHHDRGVALRDKASNPHDKKCLKDAIQSLTEAIDIAPEIGGDLHGPRTRLPAGRPT